MGKGLVWRETEVKEDNPREKLGVQRQKIPGHMSRQEKPDSVKLKQQERKGNDWSHSIEGLTSRAHGGHQLLLDK